jgi:hypothetical protein
VVDVMEVALADRGVFMCWHAKDAEVALTWYRKGNGIHPPPIMTQIAQSLCPF